MDQASRIIAQMEGVSDVISPNESPVRSWKRAVGKKYCAAHAGVKLVRTTLVVEVEDEIWRKNLWKLRFQILRNLEKALGPEIVADLEFRVMPPRREPQRETGEPPGADAASETKPRPSPIRDFAGSTKPPAAGAKPHKEIGLKLTEKEVRYVANLANLNLTDDEIARMVHDLGSILEHMDRLAGIDTEGVEPMAQVLYEAEETATLRAGRGARAAGERSWRWRMRRLPATDISKSRK